MHESSLLRMQWFIGEYADTLPNAPLKVLDVGSYNVNGSYRPLFDPQRYHYTGLDMTPGPNVDVVLKSPYHWKGIPTNHYDVVISGQAFEHIEFFWKTMEEMARVLRPQGLLCLIAPNGFVEHRYPVDCYRFFTDGMLALARYVSLEPLHAHTNRAPDAAQLKWFSHGEADAMLVARKPYAGKARLPNFKKYKCDPAEHETYHQGFVSPS